jgi:hypothetical protein
MNIPPIPARDPITAPTWLTWFSALVSGLRSDAARISELEAEVANLKARVRALESAP